MRVASLVVSEERPHWHTGIVCELLEGTLTEIKLDMDPRAYGN